MNNEVIIMYRLNINDVQQTTGGALGMTPAQMQYLGTIAFGAVSKGIAPSVLKMAGIASGSGTEKFVSEVFTLVATGASFLAGNRLLSASEADKK